LSVKWRSVQRAAAIKRQQQPGFQLPAYRAVAQIDGLVEQVAIDRRNGFHIVGIAHPSFDFQRGDAGRLDRVQMLP
jgi:hypothetical protein